MEYVIGTVLGLVVAAFAGFVGLDRGRSFYPTVAIVVASYDTLFAVMGTSAWTLGIEILIGAAFSAVAVCGFMKNTWLVAAAIAGHGVFDMLHHLFIDNPGMPLWWPGFCASIDVFLGGWLAVRLLRIDPDKPLHYTHVEVKARSASPAHT